jgi:dipeptidase E
MRLLLLSNSRNPGGGWLDHAEAEIRDFLGAPRGALLFFPFAAVAMSFDAYTAMARKRFARMGYRLIGAQRADRSAARTAAGFVAGGGNTFRLLDEMQRRGWLSEVKRAVRRGAGRGVPYIGWSAGSNLACPGIRTTNDMPIVEPRSLAAMGLLPFQLNPHYTERSLPRHGGETRDQRIAEFQALNPGVPVLGLREGSLLRLESGRLELRLGRGARLFLDSRKIRNLKANTDLSFLLK